MLIDTYSQEDGQVTVYERTEDGSIFHDCYLNGTWVYRSYEGKTA